jgi:hypothetical protein
LEADSQKRVREYWASGHFFSEKQFAATEKSLDMLIDKIKGKTFGKEDVSVLLLHAPATNDQVRSAVSQQISSGD